MFVHTANNTLFSNSDFLGSFEKIVWTS